MAPPQATVNEKNTWSITNRFRICSEIIDRAQSSNWKGRFIYRSTSKENCSWTITLTWKSLGSAGRYILRGCFHECITKGKKRADNRCGRSIEPCAPPFCFCLGARAPLPRSAGTLPAMQIASGFQVLGTNTSFAQNKWPTLVHRHKAQLREVLGCFQKRRESGGSKTARKKTVPC